MEQMKSNLLRRAGIIVSLMLVVFGLSACGGDNDESDEPGSTPSKSDEPGSTPSKSIVGVWNVLGLNDETIIFSDSGKGRYVNNSGNGYGQKSTDFSYEMAGDGGFFIGFGWKGVDYNFEFMGPYIVIPGPNQQGKYRFILYKKDNLGKGSLSDFKGKFRAYWWESEKYKYITFNGDGTGEQYYPLTYTMKGKNHALITYYYQNGIEEEEAIIYEDVLYLQSYEEPCDYFREE